MKISQQNKKENTTPFSVKESCNLVFPRMWNDVGNQLHRRNSHGYFLPEIKDNQIFN